MSEIPICLFFFTFRMSVLIRQTRPFNLSPCPLWTMKAVFQTQRRRSRCVSAWWTGRRQQDVGALIFPSASLPQSAMFLQASITTNADVRPCPAGFVVHYWNAFANNTMLRRVLFVGKDSTNIVLGGKSRQLSWIVALPLYHINTEALARVFTFFELK